MFMMLEGISGLLVFCTGLQVAEFFTLILGPLGFVEVEWGL